MRRLRCIVRCGIAKGADMRHLEHNRAGTLGNEPATRPRGPGSPGPARRALRALWRPLARSLLLALLGVVPAACTTATGGAADATSAGDAGGSGPWSGAEDGSAGLVIDIGGGGGGDVSAPSGDGAGAGTGGDSAGSSGDAGQSDAAAPDAAGDAGGGGGHPDVGGGGHPDASSDGGGLVDGASPDTVTTEDVAADSSAGSDALLDTGATSGDVAGDDAGDGVADDVAKDAGGFGDDALPADAGAEDVGGPDVVVPPAEICTNGTDDDGDGKVDCADADCVKKPGCFELCTDGLDNDVDGLTDCADPDCKGKPGCVEVCDDGKDNDLDGATDCADPECAGGPSCKAGLTCDDMYTCMTEAGCGCKVGTSCPANGGSCIQACFNSAPCYAGCLDTLSPPMQAHWNDWQACLTEQCGSVPDAEFEACYTSKCLGEYASCFYAGTLDCETVYQSCLPACAAGDQHCIDACFDKLTPEAGVDSVLWNNCRFALCDPGDTGTADSLECLVVATWFACVDVAGSCLPTPAGAKTCSQTSQCILGCGGFGTAKQQCMFGCLGGVAPGTEPPIADVWTCAIGACGTSAAAFTPACVTSAFDGPCAPQAAGCGL